MYYSDTPVHRLHHGTWGVVAIQSERAHTDGTIRPPPDVTTDPSRTLLTSPRAVGHTHTVYTQYGLTQPSQIKTTWVVAGRHTANFKHRETLLTGITSKSRYSQTCAPFSIRHLNLLRSLLTTLSACTVTHTLKTSQSKNSMFLQPTTVIGVTHTSISWSLSATPFFLVGFQGFTHDIHQIDTQYKMGLTRCLLLIPRPHDGQSEHLTHTQPISGPGRAAHCINNTCWTYRL